MKRHVTRRLAVVAIAASSALVLPTAPAQALPLESPNITRAAQDGGGADEIMAEVSDAIGAGGSVIDIVSLVPTEPMTLTVEPTQKSAVAATAVCTIDPRNAHYSYGAGGAIFKTAVKCTGSGIATVTVRINGQLSFAPSPGPTYPQTGPTQSRASSTQIQTIAVNGAEVIYYTPLPGANGGTGTGSWIRTVTGEIVAPIGGVKTPGSATKVNWCALYAGPSC